MKKNTVLYLLLGFFAFMQVVGCATQKNISKQPDPVQQREEDPLSVQNMQSEFEKKQQKSVSGKSVSKKENDSVGTSEGGALMLCTGQCADIKRLKSSKKSATEKSSESNYAQNRAEKKTEIYDPLVTEVYAYDQKSVEEKKPSQKIDTAKPLKKMDAATMVSDSFQSSDTHQKTLKNLEGKNEKFLVAELEHSESESTGVMVKPDMEGVFRLEPQTEIDEMRIPLGATENNALDELPDDHSQETKDNSNSEEKSLADLITEFEANGSQYEYTFAPSFYQQMLDACSSNPFMVAVSNEPETASKIVVSRTAAVSENQRLEIAYPGHGWVYIGEQTSQQGLRYEQRKLQNDTSIFTFTAEKKGNYVLHFSYFDVFSDDFITDAVAVSVMPKKDTNGMRRRIVHAPDYTVLQEENLSEENTVTDKSVINNKKDTESTTTAAADDNTAVAPEDLLEKARKAVIALDAASALQTLDDFFSYAEQNHDEGWFLLGRAYELNGDTRNIKLALKAYKTVTQLFPESQYWNAANERIRYIRTFYVNIE